ncbi:terminase, endonuclease subunit (GpM) [Raoultella ornithinolytica]|nr:terminase, endonuclease subunit (GpM) [Raoultella ornithinolytica]
MLTPAQRHFQQVMAERRGGSDQRDAETRTAHEQILFRLHMHKSSLSQIQSRQAKAAVKASILPEFEGWIDGTIEGDSGRADPVITTLMVWAVDCSDYALALRIGRYVVKHGLSMPEDNYRRPAPTVLTEEICNPILNIATTDAGPSCQVISPCWTNWQKLWLTVICRMKSARSCARYGRFVVVIRKTRKRKAKR